MTASGRNTMPAVTTLHALGIRESDLAPHFANWLRTQAQFDGFYMNDLAHEELARNVWNRWNPDQPDRIERDGFRSAFERLLADCLSMGMSIDRLRSASIDLPEPGRDSRNWMGLFEKAIAGTDKCSLHITMSPARYRECIEGTNEPGGESWAEMQSMMRDGLFYELGIIYPSVELTSDPSLEDEEYRIEWNDLKLPGRRGIAHDRAFINDTPDRLKLIDIVSEPAVNPANGNQGALVDIADEDLCKRAGLTTWGWMGYRILEISSVLRRASGAFVNIYLVERQLDQLAQAFPSLVEEVRKEVDHDVLTQVIRGLLDEEISVRDLRCVLESMLVALRAVDAPRNGRVVLPHPASDVLRRQPSSIGAPTVADYVAFVREAMQSYISHKYARGSDTLYVYRVAPAVEARLGQPANLAIEEAVDLLKEVRHHVSELLATAQNPVVICWSRIRSRLRKWIRIEFPHLAVLSHPEVARDRSIECLGVISVELDTYDESFYRLIGAMEGVDYESGRAAPEKSPVWTGVTGSVLTRHRTEIVNAIVRHFRQYHPHPMPDGVLEELVERFFDAYGEMLATGETDRLNDLLAVLSEGLRVDGTRCSHVLEIQFEIHRHTRRWVARECSSLTEDDSMQRYLENLDVSERAAVHAMDLLLARWLAHEMGDPHP